jgi:hypothetical protein
MADISCFGELQTPMQLFACMSESSGHAVWTIGLYALAMLIIGGWSFVQGIRWGLPFGSFFMTLISFTLWVAGLIALNHVMVFISLLAISFMFILVAEYDD